MRVVVSLYVRPFPRTLLVLARPEDSLIHSSLMFAIANVVGTSRCNARHSETAAELDGWSRASSAR